MKMKKSLRKFAERIGLGWHVFRYGELPKIKKVDLLPLTEKDLQEIKSFYPMPKFFIFGHARSGTTLLSRLIRLHPEIHTSRLGHFFTYHEGVFSLINNPATQEWIQRPSEYWNSGKNLSTKYLRVVCDFTLEKEAKKCGKSVVGDKSNNNVVNGEAVKRLKIIYPDAKLIFLVRDGRDVILSQRFRFFIELPKYLDEEGLEIRDQLASNPDEFIKENKSVFTEKVLKIAAENWVQNVEETHYFGSELFNDNYLSFKFEELIYDPYQEMSKVWSFLNVESNFPHAYKIVLDEMGRNPDARWQERKGKNIHSIISKGERGNWKDIYTKRDREIFKGIAGETLMSWQYEKDKKW